MKNMNPVERELARALFWQEQAYADLRQYTEDIRRIADRGLDDNDHDRTLVTKVFNLMLGTLMTRAIETNVEDTDGQQEPL